MVGNDVVDLFDVDANIATYSARFDERVFRAAEREAIEREDLGPSTRWQLWAAKEACYKAAKQEDPATVFSPRSFEVFSDKRWAETWMPVQHTSGSFLVVLESGPDYVHAMAARDASAFAHVLREVVPLDPGYADGPPDPRARVRALGREAFADRFAIDPARLDVGRERRVPKLRLDGEPLDLSLSLSHHGRWLAFTCELMDSRRLEMAGEARGGAHA